MEIGKKIRADLEHFEGKKFKHSKLQYQSFTFIFEIGFQKPGIYLLHQFIGHKQTSNSSILYAENYVPLAQNVKFTVIY